MTTINAILRDGSNVDMPALRTYLAGLEARNAAQDAALTNGTVSAAVGDRVYLSQSELFADLVPADGEAALVLLDPDPSKNGLYVKNGATTAGDWDGPSDLFASVASNAVAALAADINASVARLEDLRSIFASYSLLTLTTSAGYWDLANDGALAAGPWESVQVDGVLEGDAFLIDADRFGGANFAIAQLYDPVTGDTVGDPLEQGDGDPDIIPFTGLEYIAPGNGTLKISSFVSRTPTVRKFMVSQQRQISIAPHRGKLFLSAGTSIQWGGYPQIAGDVIGATVLNRAKPASTARFGVAANRSASDPHGIGGLAVSDVMLCASATIEEKQALIDDWETTSSLLTDAPETPTSDQIAEWLAHCWESLYAPYFGTIDGLLWGHGHNDWARNIPGALPGGGVTGDVGDMRYLPTSLGTYPDPLTGVGANADPTRDRGTFLGASNYIFDQFRISQPNLPIAIDCHYETDRKGNIVEGQIKLAGLWGAFLIDNYNGSGVNQQTIRDADGEVQTVGGNPLTSSRSLMDDDLHPYQAQLKNRLGRGMAMRMMLWPCDDTV
ncbi:hypothetical protein IP68_02150 [Blastomonas sp. AAP25]|uniref:hypothetical protein n=1 Tax=Blastomonas sp. AAP25 TaxID=1523416 RepID=UPI0006B957F6|nr:hypothetical protein [Blastomonas sp. AAP25]KPF76720.1 hypothetical protein IP68_02150 [Blastomonas sp. AAP25]